MNCDWKQPLENLPACQGQKVGETLYTNFHWRCETNYCNYESLISKHHMDCGHKALEVKTCFAHNLYKQIKEKPFSW
jgi:hypothetical protein